MYKPNFLSYYVMVSRHFCIACGGCLLHRANSCATIHVCPAGVYVVMLQCVGYSSNVPAMRMALVSGM